MKRIRGETLWGRGDVQLSHFHSVEHLEAGVGQSGAVWRWHNTRAGVYAARFGPIEITKPIPYVWIFHPGVLLKVRNYHRERIRLLT
jgi:hypothetical protein